MTKESNEKHTKGLSILNDIQKFLAESPATLAEHKNRLDAIDFLRLRLIQLADIEQAEDKNG